MNHNKVRSGARMRASGLYTAAVVTVLISVTMSDSTTADASNSNDVLVIVNQSVKTDMVSVDQLRTLFLKVQTFWGNGKRIVPINAAEPRLRNTFRRHVLRMDKAAEQQYWQNATVKKGEREPISMGNTLKAVFKLRGGISYIYRKDYREGVVKVVLVIPAN